MRVLFAAVPQSGHVYPMLPLANAFAKRGDDVTFATASDALRLVEKSLPEATRLASVGHGLGDWWQILAARTRGVPGDGVPIDRINPYFVPRLFADVGTADMVDDLLALARDFRPDILVFDGLCFAGPLVAREIEACPVQHTIGPVVDEATLTLCRDALYPTWRSFDHDAPPSGGLYAGVTLDICPPAFSAPHPLPGADVRPIRPTGLPVENAAVPEVLSGLPARPVVYVTLGTFMNTDSSIFRAAIEGLRDEPVNVVVTVGSDNDPAALGEVADNVRVERFVAQGSLLPHCAAVVHHAGCGTMFGTLAHGLPALAIPQGADNFTNAELLEKSGAGRRLLPGDVSAAKIRDGVRALLDDVRYRAAATRVAEEIAAMPSPDDVAVSLADATHRV